MSSDNHTAIAIHCRNVAGVWSGSLKQCGAVARVFSPYLTSGLAEEVLDSDQPAKVEVHTRFDIEAFASGASSLATVRVLVERNYPLYDVPRLHAKVFEHPQDFATVGSQNLTQRGTRNRETTVVIRDEVALEKLRTQLDRWVLDRRPITLEMIAHAEAAIADLERAFKSLRRACLKIEREAFEAQVERDAEARRAAKQAERLRRLAAMTLKLRLPRYQRERAERLAKLGGEGRVPKDACYQVAWNAMDWRIGGRIVASRRDADHLFDGPHGWEIRLGGATANRFGVELAIRWCRERLMKLYPEAELRTDDLSEAEIGELEWCVRCAIIRQDDELYQASYPLSPDGRLWLGNHGVNPKRTVAAILAFAGFKSW